MQGVRFEHEFQAALLDADSAWRDLCEFVSFRTIVRELTLRARMKGLSIQLFSPPARKLRQLAHHYHPGLGDAAAESVSARAPCRNGLCRRTHCFKGVNHCGPYELPAYGNVRCPDDMSQRQFSLATMAARSRKCRCPEQPAE